MVNTKKHTTSTIKNYKVTPDTAPLQMLTCYDYQTATLLNETELDMILVGDSLGNVILGYDNTIPVTLEEMMIFSSAVKRGAKNKFVVADMPFGTYPDQTSGIKNAVRLFQESKVEAIKIEGSSPRKLTLVEHLVDVGIPVMGHIGLTPQGVHCLGGYYIHGRDEASAAKLVNSAMALEKAGVFAVVLECVAPKVAEKITSLINIPTIGIGSGTDTDGQVLVINDLLNMGSEPPPSLVNPVADLYTLKKQLIEIYLKNQKSLGKGDAKQLPGPIPTPNKVKDLENGKHTHH